MEPFQIDVDKEKFTVTYQADGRVYIQWISGPNEDYGFSMTPVGVWPVAREAIEQEAHRFLADIDPETGYLAD